MSSNLTGPIWERMEVREEKIKEIIVHNSQKLSIKELVLIRIRPDGRPMMLFWCDGIVYYVYTIGDKIGDEELIKGRFHFSAVYYADMPEFKPILEISTEQFGGLKVPIVDTSGLEVDKALIKFLKSKPK